MSGFKEYMEVFSDKNKVEKLRNWIGVNVLEEDSHKFAVAPNKKLRISEGRWKLLVGHAVNLVNAVARSNAPEEEARNAVRYLFVCINSIKYGLDPKAAKVALNIEEYENKYWRKQA